jgi:DHA1 family bicyclomycin/chloramphenicol resistance-like MFS transporter
MAAAKNPSMKEFIVLMASLMSIVAISIDATLPALGYISKDLAIDNPNHAQYIIGFIFIGMAIGQLICGPLSDAMGRKRVLYFGLGVFMAGSAVCFFAQNLTVMLFGRFIQGLGVSGPYVSSVAIVRDKYSGRDMARIMSLVMMIFILVPAIAPSLGQALMLISSWRIIFALYIVYAIVIIIWLHFRLEETLKPENRIKFSFRNFAHGFGEIMRNRTTVCYTICMGICFGSFLGYLTSSQQIFQNHFKTGEMFTIYFGILALVLGVASFANSYFVQTLGMRFICKRSILAVIISSAVFLVLDYAVEIQLWMFMCYAAILFFCFGLVFGNLNSIAMEPMGHIAGMATAIIGCFDSVVSTILGAVIGQLYDNTLVPMTLGFLVLGVISIGVMACAEGRKFAKE